MTEEEFIKIIEQVAKRKLYGGKLYGDREDDKMAQASLYLRGVWDGKILFAKNLLEKINSK